jgi:hypothetical protein
MFARLHHAARSTARHLHNAYSQARTFAGHADRAFGVVSRIAHAVQKPLGDYAPEATQRLRGHADVARREYESLRTKLGNADSAMHRTGAAIRSSVPELGL